MRQKLVLVLRGCSEAPRSPAKNLGCGRGAALSLTALSLLLAAPLAFCAAEEEAPLAEMSLEALLDLEVTSVSKKAEPREEAPAAIYVITAEDIRRSGVSAFPELFRLVPGMNVARVDVNQWAISARGFNGLYANKLLVLMDGRSLYAPFFAGVLWEYLDITLEDIERIEVIRGPGGTLWGANAVNGVINIITKHARETQGGLISAESGTDQKIVGVARYGGKLSDKAFYRLTLKHADRKPSVALGGGKANDTWHTERANLRLDWQPDDDDDLMLSSSLYGTGHEQTYRLSMRIPWFMQSHSGESETAGGHLLGRWSHRFSEDSETTLMLYYDHEAWETVLSENVRRTYDVDFQHRLALSPRHELVWGMEMRYNEGDIKNSYWLALDPRHRRGRLMNVFLQDEIRFLDERLRLTLGAKLGFNDYSGIEVQPNLRIAWVPSERQTVWAAVSRAVRTPSQIEHYGRITSERYGPLLTALVGNTGFDAEDLLAWEFGYRVRPAAALSLSASLFYHDYRDLRTLTLGLPWPELVPLLPHFLLPARALNRQSGSAAGIEVEGDWRARPNWLLRANYTFMETHLHTSKGVHMYTDFDEANTPRHTALLMSRADLTKHLEWDVVLRYVDELESIDIPGYCDLDMRLGWHPRADLEIAIAVENLLESRRQEFEPQLVDVQPTQVERAFWLRVTWRF